jgi:dTDP-4-amino-4,6-dideoxygalactose transaminase
MYRIGQAEIDAVARVIKSGELFRVNSAGRECEHFEREWAEKLGARHAILLSSGTAALTCALVGCGVGPGDEVIVPAYTFMATALAVASVGAIPVLAEVDESLTLDLADAERKITPSTKAVIPVHIVGLPSDMGGLNALKEKYGFAIVEDACQADGGSYGGRRHGLNGDAGCFSFNNYKLLSAGEGGAIVADDRKLYERALIYHDGGIAWRPYAEELAEPIFMGTQYRSNEITGAIMREQLKRMDGILADLRRNKKAVMDGLAGVPNLRFAPCHDPAGDTGATLAFSFDGEKTARAFSAQVGGLLPIDSGKHVYYNWEPLMEKRGAHCPAMDPFRHEKNRGLNMDYSRGMCPNTVAVLSRTVLASVSPDWTEAQAQEMIGRCRKAAETL